MSCIFVDTYSAARHTSCAGERIIVYGTVEYNEAYNIVEVFPWKVQVKSVIQVLRCSDGSSRARNAFSAIEIWERK